MKLSRLSVYGEAGKGYICVFEDLTQVKEMQEKIFQAEHLATVGRLSAGLAHEIRNPLASLSGSIQVLKKGLTLENTHKRLMDIVVSETGRLNNILTDFLNYSQPRKDRKIPIDLTQLINDVIILIKNDAVNSRPVNVEFKQNSFSLVINGDEEQFKGLVWNLCMNGIQAMSKEGGTLKIFINPVSSFHGVNFHSKKSGVVLTVEDEGCGIPSEKLNKIFDPFYTTKSNGVGLGLATVYQIVQQNHGAIDVKSELGKGTRFSIYLPEEQLQFDNGRCATAQ